MFALVKFDDGTYFICRTNSITSKSGDTCCVKYKNGGRYPAREISLNADRKFLEDVKRKMEACDESENNPDITTKKKRKKKINSAKETEMLNNNRDDNDTSQQVIPQNQIYEAKEVLDNDRVLTDTTNQICKEKIRSEKVKDQDIYEAKEILDNDRVLTDTTNQICKEKIRSEKVTDQDIYEAKEILDNDRVLTDTTNQICKEKIRSEKVTDQDIYEAKEILDNDRVLTDTTNQICKEKIRSEKVTDQDIYEAKEILDNDRVLTDTTNQICKEKIQRVKDQDILNNNGVPTSTLKQNKLKIKMDMNSNPYNTPHITNHKKTSDLEDLLESMAFQDTIIAVSPTNSHFNDASNITVYGEAHDAVVNGTFTMFVEQQSAEFVSLDAISDICNITPCNADHPLHSVTSPSNIKVNDDIRCRIISDQIINMSTEAETTHVSNTNTSSDFTKIFHSGINEESLLNSETSLPLMETANIPSTSSASETVFDAPCNSGATSTPLQGNSTFEVMNETGMKKMSDSGSEYEPSANDISSDATFGEENSSQNGEELSSKHSEKRSSNQRRKTGNSSRNSSANVSSAFEPKVVRDIVDMFVVTSDSIRGQGKRTYCMYCQTMQCKFARHLELVHKDIPEVKAFSALPKGTAERKKIIDTIRKNCQFSFNTDNSVNDGELIVCRRPSARLRRMASDFQVCHHCKGFYSKNNIRHHAQHCFGYDGKKSRTLMIMGRKVVAHIHEVASERLINIFAVLREDAIVRLLRYDRLLILYGNKLCCKYKKQHDGDMIRAHLRMLGRLLSALKQINKDIIEFATIYDPKYYDNVISAINIVSGFNEKIGTYTHPSTAYNLGSFVKQIGNLLIVDCIKRHAAEQKANTEDFLKLALDDIGVSVNKTVVESQTQQKRRKKTELPSVRDIRKLLAYIDEKRKSAYQILQTEFTYDAWLTLAQTTLTYVQVFNRRRAGEIERVFIEDFENFEGINEDLLRTLSAEAQILARKYVRFVIRGKLNRTVPVLLSSDLKACIQMILKYRCEAQVPSGNRYVFGIPGFEKNRYKYLRACYLLRKFARESGADFPANLTGTRLRKHIATNCINLNLSENEVTDVANFMGHADKIHKEHYRQPIVSREILRMSRVLELAQGGVEDAVEGTDDEGENSYNNPLDDGRKTQKVTNNRQKSQKTYDASCEMDDNSSNSDADLLSEVENNSAPRSKRKGTSKSKAIDQKKKKRSTSPYGAVKSKPRWTQDENKVAHKLFGEHIRCATYPSLKSIQKLCIDHPSLAKRSPTVIKTWISNKIKKNKLGQ